MGSENGEAPPFCGKVGERGNGVRLGARQGTFGGKAVTRRTVSHLGDLSRGWERYILHVTSEM